MPTKLCFIDIETLSLALDTEIFEVAFIDEDGEETVLWLPVDLTKANQDSLRLNRFYLRREDGYRRFGVDLHAGVEKIAKATTAKRLAGNNVGPFDQVRLGNLLLRNGYTPAWEHRVTDVIDYAAGAIGMKGTYASKDVSKALGIPEANEGEAHTALADARWGKLVYEKALAVSHEREKRIQVSLAGLLPPLLYHFTRAESCVITTEYAFDSAERLAKSINEQCWPPLEVKK
jgi:hypothetical protein